MVFCGKCGKIASDEDKFCIKCGELIKEITVEATEEIGEIIEDSHSQLGKSVESESSQLDIEENLVKQTTRDLGNKLEAMVEKIFQIQGYETKMRQKLQGKSGAYNEIDVIATRKSVKVAIECKNYSEERKVGIKEIRDFVTKLEDLEIHKGFVVTNSYFSEEARTMADSNPNEKQIELWDKEELTHYIITTTLGRDSQSNLLARTLKIENALPLQGSIEDYTILHLKNKDKITIKQRVVTFVPVYIVSFNLHEEFRAPDRRMHSHHNEGSYHLDGISGRFLCRKDNSGTIEYDLSSEEQQMIRDLHDFEPRMIEVEEENNSRIVRLPPSINKKNIEFLVRNRIQRDNKKIIPYEVKIGRDKIDRREFPHMPNHNAIQCQTRIVSIPRLEIEFESKEHIYGKIVMMASGVVIKDEIADCKHFIGKNTTFAVCDVCGVAKCEKDIILGNDNESYCKSHIPNEIKQKRKENSLTGKLKQKFFKP